MGCPKKAGNECKKACWEMIAMKTLSLFRNRLKNRGLMLPSACSAKSYLQ